MEELKAAICKKPVIALPRAEGRFYLDTDASNVGIGGVLRQEQIDENGKKHLPVIYFGSKGLSPTERGYGTPKLEMLAVVYFCEKFEVFLTRDEFTLRTDHKSLSFLKTWQTRDFMTQKWIEKLSIFRMVVEHTPRENNAHADGLSKRSNFYECNKCLLIDNAWDWDRLQE